MAAINSALSSRKAALFALLAFSVFGLFLGCDRGESSGQQQVNAREVLSGVVVDSPVSLSSGATPLSYPGAVVTVCEAIESGTCRVSADAPLTVSYEPGDEVAEVTSGADGTWEVELPPGTYFVRALFGEQSYSEDVLVEVVEEETVVVTLELIHGV
ncbi:MAG: hypothetical protein JW846_10475 [Dehalococcoidia bacterium]|nr:hypothetical protein [Dehalococcoidia bacterium]